MTHEEFCRAERERLVVVHKKSGIRYKVHYATHFYSLVYSLKTNQTYWVVHSNFEYEKSKPFKPLEWE